MRLTDRVIRNGLLNNLDKIKLLMVTKNDIVLIDLISKLSGGMSSGELSKIRAITIENASTKLYKLYSKGYLTRYEIKSVSGGIEYKYKEQANSDRSKSKLSGASKFLVSAATELESYIDAKNKELNSSISSQDLDDPDYHDYQTCFELMKLSHKLKENK